MEQNNNKIKMEKFKNKYRIQSHRKPNWDYSADALYFLTIVTKNRVCNLGKIENNEMILSDFGEIVETEWFKSFEIRKELFLHEFILMPNHLHAIVQIDNDLNNNVETHGRGCKNMEMQINTVETHGRASLPLPLQSPLRLPKSISSFIAGFKSAVNSKIDDYIDQNKLLIEKYNQKNHFFQSNYYDHIIRNLKSFEKIQYYIINNPFNWEKDTFYV